MQQSKRKTIKTRAGELGHLDCRCLGKDQIVGSKSRRYLVSVVDACTRLAWAEVADDLKSLSVMFAALKSLNLLNAEYGIRFEAVLTDNGAEAASRNMAGHPMELAVGVGDQAQVQGAVPAADEWEGGAVLADAERGVAGGDDVRDGGGVA